MIFEESYARLEELLVTMNYGKVSLDESLKLYEEADKLIASCNKRLNEAEKKIEMLLKTRSGDLVLDDAEEPILEEFNPSQGSL